MTSKTSKTLELVWNQNCRELLQKGAELVFVFYWNFLKGKNWYWYFIAEIKNPRIGILFVHKSFPFPTLKEREGGYFTLKTTRFLD